MTRAKKTGERLVEENTVPVVFYAEVGCVPVSFVGRLLVGIDPEELAREAKRADAKRAKGRARK